MNHNEKNNINIQYHEPLYSDLLSYVIFYGFIIFIIINLMFIIGVIFATYKSKPVPSYTNKYLDSSLDENSMSFASSLKTIKQV
jgi:hypothetical protein